MEYFLGEYIEDSVQHEVLDTATNKAEYCQYRAAIIRNNCLTKFRGWDKGQIGEKSREKVLDSIINEKIFFSTALGYNDPYDTLLYVNKRSLLKFVGESLDREMSTYIAELKKKNFPMGCFAQMFWTPENREKFLQSIDDEIAAIKIAIHDNIIGICLSQNTLSSLIWAHYAKDHTGVALLYDSHELSSAKCYSETGQVLNEKFELHPINYCEKRPDATKFIHDYLLYKASEKTFPVTFSGDILEYSDYDTIREIILTKDTIWSYEKEIRLIPQILNYWRRSNVAYLKIKPKAIILGAKMISSDKDIFVEAAVKAGDIVIYEAVLNDSQPGYEIGFQEIDL